MLPGLSLRGEDALAEDRTQHPDAERRADIVLVIVDQHMLDRIRLVEDEVAATGQPALDNVFLVGALAPGPDRVGANGADAAERRHVVGRARRPGRHQPGARERLIEGFGYAHGASLGLTPLCRSAFGTSKAAAG